ncbi:uncharacterized protein LOC131055410 [Cryptomeria japonica]|uniref:uncharacterized protein LOC131055410 n=1 Tax=Cryptomeria japonica TaxID=3369 RepID=UPI0025ACF983|nr:uncharacterized protein LOC131055410 [Cryptomeria japonica]XP_057845862.1 uncharacterized protein LOC131055410 [Cryptomeria japonica]XP_057845863.1 uncharacterized protein LOC131055410 [Cryptomeria japonica]
MGRKTKWESLIELDVQDIVNQRNYFSSEDLEWTPIGEGNGEIDLCAAIPFERLTDFVKGEGLLNGMKTRFVRKIHRENNPAEYTEHTTKMYSSYWCAFGPQDNRNKPPNPQRIRKFQKKRGCQTHFQVRVMYGRPHVALITYNERSHCDANGEFCHGKNDTSRDPQSALALSLSDECQSYLESLLLMGVEVDTICERHHLDHGFLELMNNRDAYMLRKDVLNAWKKIRSIRSQKNKDDAISVGLWYAEEKENFFYFQWANIMNDVPFIIGIQTPWMQETMVKHSHNSIIAMDSTFFTNKHGFQLYTLLVFDEQEAGIPVAWAISSRHNIEDINEWLVEVHRRGKQCKEDWHVNAFIVDDVAADIQAIRLPFDCQLQLCSWHIRKTWLKKVHRYARDKDVETKMLDRLGDIFCAMSKNEDIIIHLIDKFMKEFPQERDFRGHFKKVWCHDDGHIAKWTKDFRNFSNASQEINASIESYHFYIKSCYLSDYARKCTRRMDWLICTLLHRVEPFYKNKRYLQLSEFKTNFKKERYHITSLERSKTILDTDCYSYDLPNTYKVRSQSVTEKEYLVRKFGPKFLVCDCQWAKRGNICKHVLKVSDFIKRNNAEEKDHVAIVVVPLVDDDRRGHFYLENHTTDGSIPLEDEDTERHFYVEEHTTEVTKVADARSEDLKNSKIFLKSVLQKLPTTPDQISAFNGCIERFRKDLHESGLYSKFKSDLDLEEISLRRRSLWFSPIKMHKSNSSHPRSNAFCHDLNDRIEECEEDSLLQLAVSKSKKKS